MQIIRHKRQPYVESISEQEQIVANMLAGKTGQTLILTEHPPIYTIGTSGSQADVLSNAINGETIDIHPSGRGGEVTYHGPGQLISYMIADIRIERDLRKHIWRLEEMLIRTLGELDIKGVRNARGIGVWVDGLKIAAAGVRCRKWVTFHGIALNINPNLKHYTGIVPCGMDDAPVTSLQHLGISADRYTVEQLLINHANILFGR